MSYISALPSLFRLFRHSALSNICPPPLQPCPGIVRRELAAGIAQTLFGAYPFFAAQYIAGPTLSVNADNLKCRAGAAKRYVRPAINEEKQPPESQPNRGGIIYTPKGGCCIRCFRRYSANGLALSRERMPAASDASVTSSSAHLRQEPVPAAILYYIAAEPGSFMLRRGIAARYLPVSIYIAIFIIRSACNTIWISST